MKKIILCFVFLVILTKPTLPHPDGATPFWFPSTYIYGFIQGCWQSVEDFPEMTKDMWPEDIRKVCGGVMDSLRHSITFQEIEQQEQQGVKISKFQTLVDVTLPICIDEVDNTKK